MSANTSILKNETTRTKGSDAIINNINAVLALSEIIKSTLGPQGMDKMLIDSVGNTIVTNDGVEILKSIDIDHPVAQIIIDVAKAQDLNIGDGTTSCVILIAQMLEEAKKLYLRGIHPNLISKYFIEAINYSLLELENLSIDISKDLENYLTKIILTAMRGKSSEQFSPFLAQLLVKNIINNHSKSLKNRFSKKSFKNIKIVGPDIQSSKIIRGVVFDKRRLNKNIDLNYRYPNILICSCPIEIPEIENSHQIQISNYEQYEEFISQEKNYLSLISQKIIELGINIVICQKGVDDTVVSKLSQHNILVLRRCKKSDIDNLSTHSNTKILSDLSHLNKNYVNKILKTQIIEFEKEEVISFEIENSNFLSLIICGSTKHVLDEIERAVEDSVGDISNTLNEMKIVGGGGCNFMALHTRLIEYSKNKHGKEKLIIEDFANSYLSIPKILAQNSGLDELEIISDLKYSHLNTSNCLSGIDATRGIVSNVLEHNIVEPIGITKQILMSSKEAVSLILRIDDIIAAKKIEPNSFNVDN
ncbi:MAG: thermosome subunit alpha [Candidatus Woesearchaeota archaeon]